jgi:epoxyqueuosine reductase QueG
VAKGQMTAKYCSNHAPKLPGNCNQKNEKWRVGRESVEISENGNHRFATNRQIAMTNRKQAVIESKSDTVNLFINPIFLFSAHGWCELGSIN